MPVLVMPMLAFALVAAPPAPRRPMPRLDHVTAPREPAQLAVKFRDDLAVRPSAAGLMSAADADLDGLEQVLSTHGATCAPMIALPAPVLRDLEVRAMTRSGRAQPDLAGFAIIDVEDSQRDRLAAALNDRADVEVVWYQLLAPPPPCEDISPVTPDYVAMQGYRGPNPGLNMDATWLLGNARGDGVGLGDCEYGLVRTHEDLCNVRIEPGQTVHPAVETNGWDEHGTAVMGELVSLDNAYGCVGLVPDATVTLYPEWTLEGGFRRTSAISAAIAAAAPGDVVLLEMQTIQFGEDYGPAELDFAVWSLVSMATDAGVIVVGAAGNGDENLDAPEYLPYMNRGDSGGLIVGGGSASITHSKHPTSTFGSRVNVQGWGSQVFSLGYGSFAQLGGDKNQRYTAAFGGTSGASAMIAGACVAIQGLLDERCLPRLDAWQMREVLITTGHAQGGAGGNVGPFPDVVAAAVALGVVGSEECDCPPDLDGDGEIAFNDLLVLLAHWGTCTDPKDCPADFDSNDQVDFADLLMMLSVWGPCTQ